MVAGKTFGERFFPQVVLVYLMAFLLLTGTASAQVEQWTESGDN